MGNTSLTGDGAVLNDQQKQELASALYQMCSFDLLGIAGMALMIFGDRNGLLVSEAAEVLVDNFMPDEDEYPDEDYE